MSLRCGLLGEHPDGHSRSCPATVLIVTDESVHIQRAPLHNVARRGFCWDVAGHFDHLEKYGLCLRSRASIVADSLTILVHPPVEVSFSPRGIQAGTRRTRSALVAENRLDMTTFTFRVSLPIRRLDESDLHDEMREHFRGFLDDIKEPHLVKSLPCMVKLFLCPQVRECVPPLAPVTVPKLFDRRFDPHVEQPIMQARNIEGGLEVQSCATESEWVLVCTKLEFKSSTVVFSIIKVVELSNGNGVRQPACVPIPVRGLIPGETTNHKLRFNTHGTHRRLVQSNNYRR